MNKMTVAVLSLLSVAMFAGSALAGAVPDGFAEVPWGSNRAQVQKVIGENGYRQLDISQPGKLEFKGAFAGERCRLSFSFISNSLYSGYVTYDRSPYPQVPRRTFEHVVKMLSEKYGPPQKPGSFGEGVSAKEEKQLEAGGAGLFYEWTEWNLVDSKSSDKYTIEVDIYRVWYADGTLQYSVNVSYSADSLRERLKKKGL